MQGWKNTKAVGTLFIPVVIAVPDLHAGHFVPSKAVWRKFLREYMMDPFADIPSPGPSNSSVPGSGEVTPTNWSAIMKL
jgi:hypothetical protein